MKDKNTSQAMMVFIMTIVYCISIIRFWYGRVLTDGDTLLLVGDIAGGFALLIICSFALLTLLHIIGPERDDHFNITRPYQIVIAIGIFILFATKLFVLVYLFVL